MVELALLAGSSTLTIALAVAFITSLAVVAVFAICPKKEKIGIPDVPLTPAPPNNIAASPFPGIPAPCAPAPALGVPSLDKFKGSTTDGVIDNMEAPDTVRNNGADFNADSINFSNISDFRGDRIALSTHVQDERARTSAAISARPGQFQPIVGADSDESDEETDSEYDEEDEEYDDDDGPAPQPPARITIQGRPPIPGMDLPGSQAERPDSYRTNLQADLEAGIQRNPLMSTMPKNRGNTINTDVLHPTDFTSSAVSRASKGSFNINNLSFNRDSADGYGGQQVQDPPVPPGDRESTRRKKRVKKRRKKKKKKVDEHGNSVKIRRSRRTELGVSATGEEIKRKRTKIHKKKSRNAKSEIKRSEPKDEIPRVTDAEDDDENLTSRGLTPVRPPPGLSGVPSALDALNED